jgi:hypothetical protein
MAIWHLLVLPICTIGRKARLDVNTLERARKLLKSLWEAAETGDATIMDGKGTACRMVKKTLVVVRET